MDGTAKPPAGRYVKGNVILDYVKMIRANPHLPWAEHLQTEDLEVVKQLVLPLSWYSLDQFQRLGVAVFKLIAKENYAVLRAYGRSLGDRMKADNPGMIARGGSRVTLARFSEIQKRLYSFSAQQIDDIGPGHIILHIYSTPADFGIPVYIEQLCGTIERLIELSGGRQVQIKFLESVLKGAKQNTLDITWEGP